MSTLLPRVIAATLLSAYALSFQRAHAEPLHWQPFYTAISPDDCMTKPDFLRRQLPQGFTCRGTGTGIGICVKNGDRRVIQYAVAPGVCQLDFANANERQWTKARKYLDCKGTMPECSLPTLGGDGPFADPLPVRQTR